MKQVSQPQKKKSGIFFRIFIPMFILVIFQLIIFILVSLISGEFSYVKNYAHDILMEKTENRKNYVQTELQQKMSLVTETANEIDAIIDNILLEENASLTDITKDKELNNKILKKTADSIISLSRRDMVNDVFIILDTGELYYTEDSQVKAGMLIRDFDPTTNSTNDNKDLLMEIGNSSIAKELNITLDFEWTSNLEFLDENNYDFYFKTIQTPKDNDTLSTSDLGYWSQFSRVSRSAEQSIKYTVPLISDDGTVYGVVGIGLLEKMILKNIPANDFLSEQACYILGADINQNGDYSICMHSGSIFNRLVNSDTVINRKYPADKNNDEVFYFNHNSDISSIGIIKDIELYNSTSPYYNETWALICIADKTSVMKIYTMLVNIFIIASVISAIICIVTVLLVSKKISNPISNITNKLNIDENYKDIIKFSPTNISEIDLLTDAITKLQIDVKEYSSKVSKIISMTDVGMGVFMYDCSFDSVFIGRSLIKLLNFNLPLEDTYISLKEFEKYLNQVDKNANIIKTVINIKNRINSTKYAINTFKMFSIGENINKVWYKLSINQDGTNIIGIIQDITSVVLEKQKIEYERDYDTTTGLLNRRAYLKTIEDLFNHPENLKVSAFMMWDLDNLKYVNDTYGHDFGDDYIKTAANVFKQFKNYGGIVCRMSGDEFNIFLYGFNSKDEILNVINTVRENLLNSYCLLTDGTHFKIRASSGISFYPYDSTSYDMLIKYADFAMYTIKHSTKGAMAQFDMSSYNKDSILITGIEEMNKIIDERNIKYAYQTIMDIHTAEVYGYEALMRPQSNIFKSPLDLLRIAKTGAKLYEIEHLTWIESIKPFYKAIKDGSIPKNTKIFINSISNCIINDYDIQSIEQNYHDILPNIVMEILESEQANQDYIKQKQSMIKKWNGQIALDDFGSGYNNEYTLITLNPNIIKIDRSIISGCDNDISRRNIIASLTQISHLKNILVLAEGVETFEELSTVMECDVDLIQGYCISRPIFEFQDIPIDIKNKVLNLNYSYNKLETN